jgi:hypothetical protein
MAELHKATLAKFHETDPVMRGWRPGVELSVLDINIEAIERESSLQVTTNKYCSSIAIVAYLQGLSAGMLRDFFSDLLLLGAINGLDD